MILQSFMEEKQLDFNQPLLSVRRSSSTFPSESEDKRRKSDESLPKIPPIPVYKSELKSGPVRNPGTVPFQWERTPGKPKDESKSQLQGLEQPPIVPKLPPGRTLNGKQQTSNRNSETRPALHSQSGTVLSNSQSVSSLGKNVMEHGRPKAIMEDERSSGSNYDDDDGDDDNVYVDAADTLSRSESFILNCSVSCVNGMDGSELQRSGIFSGDPQTRDFMMGRFLPAAKAMASETPPHTTRKQPLPQEQLRKKVVPKERRFQYTPNNFPHIQYGQGEGLEENEDDDELNRPEGTVSGVCGLIPQFCLKSSFGLLNPVPGVRMQAQKAVSVRRLRSRYPLSASGSENLNEHARGARYEQRPAGGYRTVEIHQDKIKPKSELDHSAYGTQEINGSVLLRPLQGNELFASTVDERKEKVENFGERSISSHTKGSKNFGELLASEDNRWESGCESPVVEKTLYIDTLQKVKSSDSTSNYSETKELTDYRGDESNDREKFADSESNPIVEGAVEDEKAGLQPKCPDPVDLDSQSSIGRLASEIQINDHRDDGSLIQGSIKLRSLETDENKMVHLESEVANKLCIQEHLHGQNLAIITISGSVAADTTKEKIDLEIELHKRSSASESSNGNYPHRPVPPPLPKAPSDSWLKRTLPTISEKTSVTWSSSPSTNNYTTVQALKNTPVGSKWETIVKTSNVQHGHLRFSAEKLNPIPEA